MPEPIFPDKRTRSQVALPDDILRMTQRSPMKEAKTALKAQAATDGATSTSMASSDDELLLSPGKQDWNSSRSKRSAPSEVQGEYLHSPGSSHGREPKRVKRDILSVDAKIDELSQLASVHTHNMSEPTIPTAKRRHRKRSNTTSNKPISTVTASPPPSQYTPCSSPTKGRARSVPIFPVTHEIPHIDFRNFLKTPVRSRSSSLSPTKNKLRGGFPGSSSLPTIHDESTASVDVSGSSASVERNIPPIVELPPSSSPETIVNPPMPSTLFKSFTLPIVPATPVTESLNRLIPMSPLTPVPETPLPGRMVRDVEAESRYDTGTGWGSGLFAKELVKPNGSSKDSRLPRPMAPPPPRPLTFAPVASGSKKPMITATKAGKDGQPPHGKNVYDIMMKRPTQPSIFAVPVGSERSVPLNRPKARMKEKMKPKKPKVEKPLLPLDDDEEEMEDPVVERGEDTFGTPISRISPGLQLSTTAETMEAAGMHGDEGEASIDHATVIGDPQVALGLDGDQGSESVAKVDTSINTGGAQSSRSDDSLPGAVDAGPEMEKSKLGESSRSQTKSRLPLGKKRQPISMAPVGRVTRSTSKQQEKGAEASPQLSSTRTKTTAASGASLKRTASGRMKKSAPADEARMNTDHNEESDVLPPGSPMKTSSPTKTPSHSPVAKDDTQTIEFGVGKFTLAKTPVRSRSSVKPASSPSPSKIARATSLFIKPTITSVSHTFATESGEPTASTSGSLLSTLSNALEKLRMPPPPRPNTTMGFNRNTLGGDDDDTSKPTSKDDSALNPSGDTRPAVGLKRSVTLGAGAFRGPTSSSTSNGKKLVQKPISSFWLKKGNGINAPAKMAGNSKFPHFGVGGPLRKTISKKSDLPVVMGSPVKGATSGDLDLTLQEIGDDQADGTGSLFEDTEGEPSFKGKEKANSRTSNASRRVSMVSHALSQSLSSLPQTSGLGQMGPPPTPPSARSGKRSTSSTLPANSSAPGGSPSQVGPSNAPGTRSSSRIATKASQTKLGTDAPISSGRKGADAVTAAPTNPVPESLKILDGCVIFVDVKTDDGGEAGSLFGTMLESIGAKVLTRVGQTCTHIVYKNGLMSTLTRYRLLRDPKPLVVGIGWVVECVEKMKHIDETDFLVDVEGVNVAGINKRRRSILPKLFADVLDTGDTKEGAEEDDGDKSIDGSASQEDLAPLERARRRKSMLVGPRP